MDEVKRTSLMVLLAGLVGFAFGATALAYAAMFVGFFLLSFGPGGLHSDWAIFVLLGTLACFVLGGVAGAKAAVRLVKWWRSGTD
jgi:hypothetical protein